MSAVEVHNLRKAFRRGGVRHRRRAAALDGVTFEVERGECMSILGRNGSGKSTLVRILSTLILPDAGGARLFGHDVVTEGAAVRRFVNRVSVEASFFKKMSPVENLSYAARFYGLGLAILNGAGVTDLWADIWPLLVIGVVSIPLGFFVFHRGEVYAKRNGMLKRSG